MRALKWNTNILLVFILLVGFILRFYQLTDIPFTHDEFSAYFRTKFDTFSDLIAYGARIDGHPAGIQVFLFYWIHFFGEEQWVVKLPFLLFGMGSLYFLFRIGKLWFNETVGLLATSFMAVSQFPVMYSQIARPYISGLFFSLLLFWFWSNLVKSSEKHFWRNGIGFVLAGAFCAYNHHFSMLFAALVGIVGLFIIPRSWLWKYLSLGVLVVVLYLPHLEILLHQMSMKGVEGWLAKPEYDFILHFSRYIFNYSWWFLGMVLVLISYTLVKQRKLPNARVYAVFLALFLFPFLIGFFYSKYVSAVLQFSVLIFSYPFLYFVLFGHIKKQHFKINMVLVTLVMFVGTWSLIFERKHYSLFYKDHFEHALLDFHAAKELTENTLPAIIDTRKDIIYYYAERYDLTTDFKWHDDFTDLSEAHDYIAKAAQSAEYFYLGMNARFNPLLMSMVQVYFPNMVFQHNYFIGTHYLFAKGGEKQNERHRRRIQLFNSENTNNQNWTGVDSAQWEENGYQMNEKIEFSPTFHAITEEVVQHRNDYIEVRLKYQAEELPKEAMVVISLSKGEEKVHWLGIPLAATQLLQKEENGEQIAFANLKLADVKNYQGSKIKVYVWNIGRETFTIQEIAVFNQSGNPVIYGLFEPL
jgi:hypothetical protein